MDIAKLVDIVRGQSSAPLDQAFKDRVSNDCVIVPIIAKCDDIQSFKKKGNNLI